MKSIRLNLPVKNVHTSKSFFKETGFEENPMHANADNLGSSLIGEHNFVLILFPEYAFQHFSQAEISDTSNNSEIFININV